jgi:hypothetical protein
VITDFGSTDIIDLSGIDIDGNGNAADDVLVFIHSEPFSAPAQVRFADGIFSINLDGDLVPELEIALRRLTEINVGSQIIL